MKRRQDLGPAGWRRLWDYSFVIETTEPARSAQMRARAERMCPDVASRCARCGQPHNGTGSLSAACARKAAA